MKPVNAFFLHTLLEPITGLADDDECIEFDSLDPDDTEELRRIIRTLIVPHAQNLSREVLEKVRIAYRYFLSKPNSNFERVFNSVLPPFNPPSDPRLFFLLIWEECFPGEEYLISDFDQYVEKPDINEANQI